MYKFSLEIIFQADNCVVFTFSSTENLCEIYSDESSGKLIEDETRDSGFCSKSDTRFMLKKYSGRIPSNISKHWWCGFKEIGKSKGNKRMTLTSREAITFEKCLIQNA